MAKLRNGFSLIEVMVAAVMLSVVLLAGIRSFFYLARSIGVSKNSQQATQWAQLQVDQLKQVSYHRIYASSSPIAIPSVTPIRFHDPAHYPPETYNPGGVPYTAYTWVEKVFRDLTTDQLVPLGWNAPDTGLKRIVKVVTWNEDGGIKHVVSSGLAPNQNRQLNSVQFMGTVRDAGTGTPLLSDAVVEVVENPVWQSRTGATGQYSIFLLPGTYSLRAKKLGYFPFVHPNQIVSYTSPNPTVNFFLTKKATGTVAGAAWITDHLVISRIVGNRLGYEYVEIFNPTTWTWLLNGQVGLRFQRTTALDPGGPTSLGIHYVNNDIPAGRFFLYANEPLINLGAGPILPDAYWDPIAVGNLSLPYFSFGHNVIPINSDGVGEGPGVLELYDAVKTLDVVGWTGAGFQNPARYHGSPINENVGLENNEQYCRISSTSGFSVARGPAYDSFDNSKDFFVENAFSSHPRWRATLPLLPVLAGTPALGAWVSANDDLSSSTQTYLATAGGKSFAAFSLPSVATGTWTVSLSSAGLLSDFPMTVLSGITVSTSVVLRTFSSQSFLSGKVTDSGGNPLNSIPVSAGTASQMTGADGRYRLAVDPGPVTLVANAGGAVSPYTEQILNATPLPLQNIALPDLALSVGATLRGRVTSDGVTPLADVTVQAIDPMTLVVRAEAVSQADGSYSFQVPSGMVSLQPFLEADEASLPTSIIQTPAAGSTLFVGTFTVTLSYGFIEGEVRNNGDLILIGVFIHAANKFTLSVFPSIISWNSSQPIGQSFGTVSGPDGKYRMKVRSGTGYNVFGYYTEFSGNNPTTQGKGVTGLTVPMGGSVTVNLNWP